MLCSDEDEVYKSVPHYKLPTMMGLWDNALAIEEAKTAITAYKSNHCQLLSTRTKNMLRVILEPVTLNTAIETLEYENKYQIVASEISTSVDPKRNGNQKGLMLSAVLSERDIDHATDFIHGCILTASPERTPCRRNSFFFESAENKTGHINFGEDLYIRICQKLSDYPLYVQCEVGTMDTFGTKPHVRLSTSPDVYCHFKILHWNPQKRKVSVGSKVTPNSCVIIQQVASGQNLSCENEWIPTFFGHERTVSCHVYKNANKMESAENIWQVIGAREPDKGMMIRAAKGEDIPAELLS